MGFLLSLQVLESADDDTRGAALASSFSAACGINSHVSALC